jgi:hypothetical protein
VRPGAYQLTVAIGSGGHQTVVHQTITLR